MDINQPAVTFKWLPCCILALGLSACGSGGGLGSDGETAEKPLAPSPTLSVEAIKSFSFSWSAIADTTHYQLMENADGLSGFTQVGDSIASSETSYDHIVPLYNRLNAQYILQACNSVGCTDSSTITAPDATELTDSIGYLKADNAEERDSFGSAISISSDGLTLAIGAPSEKSNTTGVDSDGSNNDASFAGAVYVFTHSGATWSQQAYIKASNTQAQDRFGTTVSLSDDGSTLAVGAPEEDGTGDDLGSVYIFTRTGTSWSEQQAFTASDAGTNHYFGQSISLSDDGATIAIGAGAANGGLRGKAYIYTRSNNSWSVQGTLTASNSGASDGFGDSISLSGDGLTVAIGAPAEDSNSTTIDDFGTDSGNDGSGAVYIFTVDAGAWTEQNYIKPSNSGVNDSFGTSLALSQDGSTLAVGALGEDGDGSAESDNNALYAGAVYIFTKTNNTWTQQDYLKASYAEENDYFGRSLSISNDGSILAIGADGEGSEATGISFDGTGEANNEAGGTGAVYIFTRSGTDWSQAAYVKASNHNGDNYAEALALSGDGTALAIGNSGEQSNATGIGGDQTDESAIGAGAVYLY